MVLKKKCLLTTWPKKGQDISSCYHHCSPHIFHFFFPFFFSSSFLSFFLFFLLSFFPSLPNLSALPSHSRHNSLSPLLVSYQKPHQTYLGRKFLPFLLKWLQVHHQPPLLLIVSRHKQGHQRVAVNRSFSLVPSNVGSMTRSSRSELSKFCLLAWMLQQLINPQQAVLRGVRHFRYCEWIGFTLAS